MTTCFGTSSWRVMFTTSSLRRNTSTRQSRFPSSCCSSVLTSISTFACPISGRSTMMMALLTLSAFIFSCMCLTASAPTLRVVASGGGDGKKIIIFWSKSAIFWTKIVRSLSTLP
eukprot:CAMPEP_0172046878 /NCGR_PEP_ID=MMETSP1043-20130122/682_1 /TAXON_ID=464988 /ORGANISM="Hemiselmis andersenii, Strain CCMP441" /LENGTH=114 /DNA_ID=CAMNT_0012705639 /DNA_START=540 /DNA_END=884 /DNA_ORIENTATION=+